MGLQLVGFAENSLAALAVDFAVFAVQMLSDEGD